MNLTILPDMQEGIGYCHDRCPAHDGKRCQILGFRAPEGHVCQPWAEEIVAELARIKADLAYRRIK